MHQCISGYLRRVSEGFHEINRLSLIDQRSSIRLGGRFSGALGASEGFRGSFWGFQVGFLVRFKVHQEVSSGVGRF